VVPRTILPPRPTWISGPWCSGARCSRAAPVSAAVRRRASSGPAWGSWACAARRTTTATRDRRPGSSACVARRFRPPTRSTASAARSGRTTRTPWTRTSKDLRYTSCTGSSTNSSRNFLTGVSVLQRQ